MNKIKILIAAHKKTPILKSDIFTPIHVGKANATDETRQALKDYIGDNTGENISNKNAQYAEITALFWAWKNLPKDITHVGLMHYGRFFNFSNEIFEYPDNIFNDLSNNTIEKFSFKDEIVDVLCSAYDLIIPEKWEMKKEHIEYEHKRYNHNCSNTQKRMKDYESTLNMYDHYCLCHVQDDMDLAIKIIKKEYPEMNRIVNLSLKDTKARFTNMFVMKRNHFDNYCSFLFNIFSKMEESKDYFNNTTYRQGSFHSRIFGFLAERLFSIYIDFLLEDKNVNFIEKQIVFAEYKNIVSLKNKPINIVMSCDNNYAPYLSIAIYSIFKHSNKEDKFNFFILDGGIEKNNINKISEFVEGMGYNITFINIDLNKFKESCPLVESSKHITLPTYFRFSVGMLLPDNLDKVLYLDIDLIIRTSLRDLYDTDINNYFAGAIEDTFDYASDLEKNLNLESKYFNAGVMLINLKKWREDSIEDLFFKNTELIKDKIVFVDQDVLNYSLDGKIKYLSYKWNLQQTAFHMTKKNIDLSDLIDSKNNPCIIHYSGHIKPWDTTYSCWHPFTEIYYRYWKESPYKLEYYLYKFYKKLFTLKHKLLGSSFEYHHLKKEKLRGMFNDRYYLNTYPEVIDMNIDPLLHYVKYGWKEGKNPSHDFNTNCYLEHNPDIKESKINPFFHYLVYGIKEQRKGYECI